MIKAINAWSLPGGLEGTLSPFDAIQWAKQYGYEGLELAIGDNGILTPETTQSTCQEIRAAAQKEGIKLETVASGLYWGRNLGDSDPAKRAQAQDDLHKMIPITAWLGAKTLLTIPGAVDVFFLPDRPVQPYEEVLTNATEGLKLILPTAEKHQIKLGIENVWNKFLTSPGEMKWFLSQFNSPWIGAYFDVGNVLPFGYPEDWIRYLGKDIAAIHFKDFRKSVGTAEGFVDLPEGDVNFPEVIKALQEIGYNGPLTAELIPTYKLYPLVRVANASTAMDAILGRNY